MPATLDCMLTTEEAAELLGVAHQTLAIWRIKGCGPRFIKMNRAVRYRTSDIEAFIAKNARENTGQ